MEQNIPLSLLMEHARTKLITAFNETTQETRLPAFLLEGIVEGILSEIRARKSVEIANDANAAKADTQET